MEKHPAACNVAFCKQFNRVCMGIMGPGDNKMQKFICVTTPLPSASLGIMALTCKIFAVVSLVIILCLCRRSKAENILLTPLFGGSHYLLFRHIGEELGNRGHKVNISSD